MFWYALKFKVCSGSLCIWENCSNARTTGSFWTRMVAATLPIFSYPFRGSSGSKSKVGCIAISKVWWTTGMLVAVEGPPDKRTGVTTSWKVILTTTNAELRTTLPNRGPLAYLYYFLELNFSFELVLEMYLLNYKWTYLSEVFWCSFCILRHLNKCSINYIYICSLFIMMHAT